MAAIQSLPVELLALVFEQLFVMSESWKSLQSYDDKDFGDPSLFPCAVARVCQLWRDVVAERPEYWEHIVFDLASEEPPFLDAFGWAKETEFEVLIFDSRYGAYGSAQGEPGSQMSERRLTTTSKTPTTISADYERAMVSAITEALIPHLERCLSLQYSTSFSDSLPEVATILHHNTSKRIRKLRLNYRINNSEFSTRALKYNRDGQTTFFHLDMLSIDVVAFVLIMKRCPQLSRRLLANFPPLSYLEISDYQFNDDHISNATSATFTLTDFVHHLCDISYRALDLCLRGLSMAVSGRQRSTDAGTTTKKTLTASRFVAIDLSEDFLQHLFQQVEFVGGLSGNFSGQCKFLVDTPALSFRILYLHGLPPDENLPRLLTGWSGYWLTITSCPCFNDGLLDALAESGTGIVDCVAPHLYEITIDHCGNFSRQALMNFFVKRNKAALSSSYLQEVKSVRVDGIRVEPTAEELALYR